MIGNRNNLLFLVALILGALLAYSFVSKSNAYDLSGSNSSSVSKIVHGSYGEDSSVNYDSVFDYENFRDQESYSNTRYYKKPSEVHQDAVFIDNTALEMKKNASFADMFFKISIFVFMLIGAIIILKTLLMKKSPENVADFSSMDFLNSPFNGQPANMKESLLAMNGLSLKQSLNLTSSQGIYVVEFEGKKLLIGCTQQGGVQLLADLSEQKVEPKKNTDSDEALLGLLKKIIKTDGEEKEPSESETPFIKSSLSNTISPSDIPNDEMNQQIIIKDVKNRGSEVYSYQESAYSKRPFRRRTNFRESLNVYTVR